MSLVFYCLLGITWQDDVPIRCGVEWWWWGGGRHGVGVGGGERFGLGGVRGGGWWLGLYLGSVALNIRLNGQQDDHEASTHSNAPTLLTRVFARVTVSCYLLSPIVWLVWWCDAFLVKLNHSWGVHTFLHGHLPSEDFRYTTTRNCSESTRGSANNTRQVLAILSVCCWSSSDTTVNRRVRPQKYSVARDKAF